jgi:hypothetical protein
MMPLNAMIGTALASYLSTRIKVQPTLKDVAAVLKKITQ